MQKQMHKILSESTKSQEEHKPAHALEGTGRATGFRGVREAVSEQATFEPRCKEWHFLMVLPNT